MPQAKRTSTSAKKGELVLEFSDIDRETKNATRFTEDLDEDQTRGHVGSIYVLNKSLEKAGIDRTKGLKVTIEELED